MNPQAGARKLRIYSFEVVNRENYTLALESKNGRLIGSNLSLFDLFSFDIPGGSSLRLNFESLFHKYEAHIEAHTKSLLAKLNARSGDIKAEIIDLFAAKLLNFVRNPFSIVKVLNSFPGVASYDPTDPALLADYRRIVSGRKPHQAHVCALVGGGGGRRVCPSYLAGRQKGERRRADYLAVPHLPDRCRGPRRLALCAAARRQRTPCSG
jgi:hypothetical protein